MRRAARVDANQGGIVHGLRAVGASVEILSAVGDGVCDLLVGFRGANFLMEIKDGAKPLSARALTPAQAEWHAAWRGQKSIVCTIDEALAVLGVAHLGAGGS